MGGLIRGGKPNGKGITIETLKIDPKNTGVHKQSRVKVPHEKSSFVMGVRIGATQTITEFKIGSINVKDDRVDPLTTQELMTALPPGSSHQWLGYALNADDLPNPKDFQTEFALEPFPLTAEPFQLVPFVIALTRDQFKKGSYLITASIITPPDGPLELRRG